MVNLGVTWGPWALLIATSERRLRAHLSRMEGASHLPSGQTGNPAMNHVNEWL